MIGMASEVFSTNQTINYFIQNIMLYDYRKENKTPMSLMLENGTSVKGEFVDLRIATDTLPKGKIWYHVRHTDDDWAEPASLKNGCVVVNFCGTFICDPIEDLPLGMELAIKDWSYLD